MFWSFISWQRQSAICFRPRPLPEKSRWRSCLRLKHGHFCQAYQVLEMTNGVFQRHEHDIRRVRLFLHSRWSASRIASWHHTLNCALSAFYDRVGESQAKDVGLQNIFRISSSMRLTLSQTIVTDVRNKRNTSAGNAVGYNKVAYFSIFPTSTIRQSASLCQTRRPMMQAVYCYIEKVKLLAPWTDTHHLFSIMSKRETSVYCICNKVVDCRTLFLQFASKNNTRLVDFRVLKQYFFVFKSCSLWPRRTFGDSSPYCVVPRKICSKHRPIIKIKLFPPENLFCLHNIKTWLRAYSKPQMLHACKTKDALNAFTAAAARGN